VAYKIATVETYPGWGYMLANGATTVWERWEKANGGGMNSHNHPMLGSISAWFYRALAGLRLDPAARGASHFIIRPAMVSGVNRASASLPTVRGTASIAWQRNNKKITMQVEIPANSRATLCVPLTSGQNKSTVLLDGKAIWSAGKTASTVTGLEIQSQDDHYLTLAAGSGSYLLISE